jgi:hypothetical protein
LSPLAPTTTTLSITPTSFSGTQTAQVTATVAGAGNAGTSPAGEIDFYNDNVFFTDCIWKTGVAGTTNTCSFEVTPSWFLNSGANQLTAKYWGDGANGPSVSNVVNFTSTQTGGDFTLAPQTPQLTVNAGSSGTVVLNLQSLSNFSGAVALTCTPSSTQFGCSVAPTVTLNGAATATLTINATVQTAELAVPNRQKQSRWPVAAGFLCFGFLLAGGRTSRKLRRTLLLTLCLFAAMATISCGSGGSTTTPPSTPLNGSAAGTYSVLVTGMANGIIHNVKITVAIP